MPSHADSRLPGRGRCAVCRKPLGSKAYVITSMPNGEHLECRDWSELPFPEHIDTTLVRLRRIRRNLKAALDLVDETGRWLVAAKRRWPTGAAETFSGVTDRRDLIRAALTKLRWPSSG